MLKVLMLGWEFPPIKSGGLGVASKALAEAVAKQDVDLTFVLPSFVGKGVESEKAKLPFQIAYNNKKFNFKLLQNIKTTIYSPYLQEKDYENFMQKWSEESENPNKQIYGKNLFEEIQRYALEVENIELSEDFDVIHAHDWITCPAALRLKKRLKIPLVIHVHATEFDRTGGSFNQEVYKIEKEAWEMADKLIAVSNYTKGIVVEHYGIDPNKIEVVHNGKDDYVNPVNRKYMCRSDKKTVLFLGRLTIQKGPDWFIKVAQKVLKKRKDVQFLIAGTGDMMPKIIDEIVAKGFHKDIFCMGFLGKEECDTVFANSDVFVMPSVSEPFGLVALEAAQRGCAVILSSQSGAKEVLANSLQADFWDVNKMANHILASLEYPALKKTLVENANKEIENLTWERQAQKTIAIYHQLVN
ncbi:glycosyltransferase family 4 protein [Patescibacteria group bacterium]|nr:glycosyltransferase family 4 protein [Patescibacteria group bacterium]